MASDESTGGGGEVRLTNLDQPLFDGAQATKRDLVEYLEAVGEHDVVYALCNDRPTLLWFANQRAVEYHPTLMRADPPGYPLALVPKALGGGIAMRLRSSRIWGIKRNVRNGTSGLRTLV